MPDARPLQPGDPPRLGSYDITGRLGEGGQGVVYLGRSASGEPVAIKLLRADLAEDDTARGRFLRELSAVKRVARFCTAQVLEADAEGDRPYIVSEYVPGPSLQQLVTDESPRSGAELERLAIGTVTALVAIHQAGIVHRDFKPQNVLIGPDGPRVIDFGIAKALDAAATMTNSTIGTPAYMAPEQLAGKEITPAADIFSWASTMVYAATGTAPFGQDTVMAVINRIISEEPDLGSLQEPLRGIVAGCLAKDPAARPAAQQLLMRLLGQEGVTPAAPGTGAAETAILGQGAAFAETRIGGGDPTAVAPTAVARAGAAGVAPTLAGAAGTTHPAGRTGGRSPLVLMAVLAGVLVVAGVAAALFWTIGRGGGKPAPGPVPSVSTTTAQPSTEPAHRLPQSTRSVPHDTHTHSYEQPPVSHGPTSVAPEPSSTSTTGGPTDGPTGKPTGGATGPAGDGGATKGPGGGVTLPAG